MMAGTRRKIEPDETSRRNISILALVAHGQSDYHACRFDGRTHWPIFGLPQGYGASDQGRRWQITRARVLRDFVERPWARLNIPFVSSGRAGNKLKTNT